MWRKAMVYLGLGDDAEYDTYDPEYDQEPDRTSGRDRAPGTQTRPSSQPSNVSAVSVSSSSIHGDEPSAIGAVRPLGGSGGDSRPSSSLGQTVNPSGGVGVPRPRPQVVRPIAVTPNAKPHLVVPDSFNEAQEVADKFKGSQPVIMNLQGSDRELSRRLIDFASGLCYGLGGQMERVANQVYLLTPSNVEVSADERRRLHDRGYDA